VAAMIGAAEECPAAGELAAGNAADYQQYAGIWMSLLFQPWKNPLLPVLLLPPSDAFLLHPSQSCKWTMPRMLMYWISVRLSFHTSANLYYIPILHADDFNSRETFMFTCTSS